MIQQEEINQKVLTKEAGLKNDNDTNKTGHSKLTKKFHQQVERDDKETYQQPDAREAKEFWSKIW